MCWCKSRHINQRIRIESSWINPYAQVNQSKYKTVKIEHSWSLYKKLNWKWFKDLNVRHTIKFLEENIDKNTLWHKLFLRSTILSNGFLDQFSQGKRNKSKNKEMVLIKCKSFCTAKETIDKTKRQVLPGSPMIKTSPSSTGGAGSIPGWGAKIPCALWPKSKA